MKPEIWNSTCINLLGQLTYVLADVQWEITSSAHALWPRSGNVMSVAKGIGFLYIF
jgi:hypothetical protein